MGEPLATTETRALIITEHREFVPRPGAEHGYSAQLEVGEKAEDESLVSVFLTQHYQRSTPGGVQRTEVTAIGQKLRIEASYRPMIVDREKCEAVALAISRTVLAAEVEYQRALEEIE